MLWKNISTILLGIGVIAALGFLLWLPRRNPDAKKPRLTGPATLLSLTAEYNHGWYYAGRFVLRDGEELQLTMLRHWYDSLKEGQSGWVTWQGNTLVEFEPNER